MERLKNLFVLKYQESPDRIEPLKGDASDRRIYRLSNAHRSVVGIIGENRAENRAFLEFSRHFKKFGLNVPEIYIENLEQGVYLEEDLGDDTLFLWMNQIREQEGFSDRIITMYQKVIEALPHFQITAGKSIDYSLCYQYMEFAEESMSWDLQYFKQRFLDMFYKKSINETAL
ncbi:MAG: phosphotransferase enzyme family protein, partial [candidate division KSB1 bacterium]|nr:phosphotransferase enzyme family protein [candidate division KSB1 bacterium]